jgi:hypothetical protein
MVLVGQREKPDQHEKQDGKPLRRFLRSTHAVKMGPWGADFTRTEGNDLSLCGTSVFEVEEPLSARLRDTEGDVALHDQSFSNLDALARGGRPLVS